jgi:glycosyltransferase involved in cell wall biosynthesis
MRLDVIMPVYNEADTVRAIADRVLASGEVARLIAVDDGSTDGSGTVLEGLARADGRVLVLRHPLNRGKGAAIRTGLAHVEARISSTIPNSTGHCWPPSKPARRTSSSARATSGVACRRGKRRPPTRRTAC